MRSPKLISARLVIAFAFVLIASTAFALFGNRDFVAGESQVIATLTAAKTGVLDTAAGGDVNGNNVINPGDRLTYTVTINNPGADAATGVNFSDTIDANTTAVGGSLIVSPIAVNDSFASIGNVGITVSAASGLLANDLNPNGSGAVAITNVNTTGVQGAVSVNNADGSFTFNPNSGFEGTTAFSYTLSNGTGLTDTAIVSITVSGMIWFVNNNAAACSTLAAGCGRLSNPFSTLSEFQALNDGAGNNPAAGDNIFLYRQAATDYAGGLTLLNNQKLIGAGANSALAAIAGINSANFPLSNALPATVGTNPVISTSAANTNGINLAASNTLRGITIGTTTGAKLNAAANVGTLTIGAATGTSDVMLNGSGQAINLTGGGTLAARFASISSTNSAATGITLTNLGGVLISPTTAITNPTGSGINVSGSLSGASFDFGNTIANQSGGTGINLANNTGAVAFADLDIAPDTGVRALQAANSTGALTTTSGTITTSGTAAVEITNASGTLPLNVQLTSVSANGGANGIVLTNTSSSGSPGGFRVLGNSSGICGGIANPIGAATAPNAADCTGGVIQNMTGADGATAGNGVYLNNAQNVSLTRVKINDHQNNGIYGSGVRGLVVANSLFNGNNGNSNSGTFDESAINLINIGGAVSITNSFVSGGAFNNARLENISGTAPNLSLTLSGNTGGTMQGSTMDVRSTAFLVSLTDGTLSANVQNNRLNSWWGNAIHVLVQGTASGSSNITGNFADNTNGALAGAGGIWIAGGAHTYNISGNIIRHTNGTAISADRGNFGAMMQGTIDGNTIGVAGDANSGSATGIGIFASHHGPGTTIVKISNNVLRQINGSASGAITTQTGDALGFGGSGTMNATIIGNNIQESGTIVNNAQHGILITHGMQSGPPSDTDQGCYDIGGATAALRNTITNFNTNSAAASQNRIRVNQRFSTTSRFPGYTGAQLGVTSQTDLASYLLARNTASNSTNANTSTGGFNNTVPAGSSCSQPAATASFSLTEQTNSTFAENLNFTESFDNSGIRQTNFDWSVFTRQKNGSADQTFIKFAAAKTSGEDVEKVENQSVGYFSRASEFVVHGSTLLSEISGKVGSLTAPTVSAQTSKRTKDEPLNLAAGETLTKTLGTLPAGESITVQFKATVNQTPTNFYAVSNTAGITAAGGISIVSTTAINAVVQPASVAKAFGASFIATGGTTSLTYTITNGNAAALSGLSFSDSLPPGLIINTPNNLTNACGGTVTAAQNTSAISLSGGTIGADTICTIKVDVKGVSEGAQISNTSTIGSTSGGNGNRASATLNVIKAPTFTKTFGAPTIQLNGSTDLSFTVTNTSAVFSLNNVSFTDALPAGLVVANPNALSGACGGGTITANQGSGAVSLAGAGLAANSGCTFSVNVTGTTAGIKNNSATVSTTELGTGAAATASVTVIAPPTIAKVFIPTSITAGNSSSVTLTLTNANATGALSNASFADALSNMTATGGAAGGTCAGASSNVLAAGASNLSFSGITIPNNGGCTVTFSVTSDVPGVQPNTTSGVSTVQTPVAGAPSNTANLTVTAAADLTIIKTHAGNFAPGEIGKTYTITASNSGGTATGGTVTVSDTLPAGLTATAIGGAGWNCVLGTLTCTRTDALAAASSYPAITLTVDVASNAPASVTNTATVSGGGEINTANNTANDPTTISPAAAYSISGRITNGGAALEGVSVALSGALSVSTATDAAGNYSFANLSGGGNYTVTPSLIGYTFDPVNTAVNNLAADQTTIDFATSVVAYEADAAPRPSGDGDGTVNGGDITVIRRLVAGIETPNAPAAGSEFQRADSAPLFDSNNLLIKGDGEINGGDITQVRLYAAGLSAVQSAGGPAAPVAASPVSNLIQTEESLSFLLAPNLIAAARDVRPVKLSLIGNVLTIAVNLNTDTSLAGANTIGFTLLYDAAVLSNPTNIRTGANAPAAATLTPNTAQTGKVGIVLDLPVTGAATTFPLADAQVVLIDFTVATMPPASTILGFGDAPVAKFVGDTSGNRLTTTFSAAPVGILAPTAAAVTVGGRALTATGRGISGIVVTMTDSQGNARTARTTAFGYYRFDNVAAGENYLLTAKGKRTVFSRSSQILNVNQDVFDADFTASNAAENKPEK